MTPRTLVDADLRPRKILPLTPELITGDECDRIFGTTREIRKNLRSSGDWYSPVHLVWLNSRHCVYRVEMIKSWVNHRHEPHIHLAECERYLQALDQKRSA